MAFIKVNIVKHIREAGKIFDKNAACLCAYAKQQKTAVHDCKCLGNALPEHRGQKQFSNVFAGSACTNPNLRNVKSNFRPNGQHH